MSAPALGDFQRALASLLYEPKARAAYDEDPEGWVRARGLTPKYAGILRSVEPKRLGYFHELQARDRTYFVEGLFPLTLRFADDASLVRRYFADNPYGHDDFAREASHFAAFVNARAAREGLVGRAMIDLAAYESALAALREVPPAAPADTGRVVLSSGIRLLNIATNVAELVDALEEGRNVRPRDAPGWIILRRDADAPRGSLAAEIDEPLARQILAYARPRALDQDAETLLDDGVLVRA